MEDTDNQSLALNGHFNSYTFIFSASVLPRVPDFGWIFTATGVTVGVNDNRKRRKREEMVPYEPPCGRTNYVVFEQVRHKPGCTVTKAS